MVCSIDSSKDACKRGSEGGFSVIELGIVTMIVMVMVSMSLLGFRKARTHYELSQNAQKLVWQIERARSLAIKQNQTLTLGFAIENTYFGLTCVNCTQAKNELPGLQLPSGIKLSAHPTITIKGNGTMRATSSTIVLTDRQGYQIPITISNSGRTTIGEVSNGGTAR